MSRSLEAMDVNCPLCQHKVCFDTLKVKDDISCIIGDFQDDDHEDEV